MDLTNCGSKILTHTHTQTPETSLVAQWPRLRTLNAGGLDSVPGQGTRSHMPQLKNKNKKTPQKNTGGISAGLSVVERIK